MTCTTFDHCSPRSPSVSKYPMARLVITGIVTAASTELIAVSVMLSATSPRKRWLNRLAVVPPGEAASSITPTASSGSRSKVTTRPKAMTGRTSTCSPSATITARGVRATRRKSPTSRESPSPNMMIARAIGRPTLISTESFIKTSARVTGATVKHGGGANGRLVRARRSPRGRWRTTPSCRRHRARSPTGRSSPRRSSGPGRRPPTGPRRRAVPPPLRPLRSPVRPR